MERTGNPLWDKTRFETESRLCAQELEWLAEGLLRLVVLVALAQVKNVRTVADYVGAHIHVLAAMFAGPLLGGFEQLCTCTETPVCIGNDKAVHFRTSVAFEQVRNAHVNPADHAAFRRFGDEYRVSGGRNEAAQPFVDLSARDWVTELAG